MMDRVLRSSCMYSVCDELALPTCSSLPQVAVMNPPHMSVSPPPMASESAGSVSLLASYHVVGVCTASARNMTPLSRSWY